MIIVSVIQYDVNVNITEDIIHKIVVINAPIVVYFDNNLFDGDKV